MPASSPITTSGAAPTDAATTPPAATNDPIADAAAAAAPAPTDLAPVVTDPIPAPVVTPTTWAVDLSGDATISSDGVTITIHHRDPSIADVTRPLAAVRDIVVTGSARADSLTVLGALGAPLRFDGGDGDDALTLPGGGSTVRLSGSRQGNVYDGAGSLSVSWSGVDDLVDGPGADTYVASGPADLARLILSAADRFRVGGQDGSLSGRLTVDEIHLAGTLDVNGPPRHDVDPLPELPAGVRRLHVVPWPRPRPGELPQAGQR